MRVACVEWDGIDLTACALNLFMYFTFIDKWMQTFELIFGENFV
jgi:hypothetical protein